MGAHSAQLQSPQSSQPASKGAGRSASSEFGSGKGGNMSAMSGQPKMGQPNTNGNTALAPVNANFVASNDGVTNANPYPNTIGNMSSVAGGINGSPYQDLPNQPNSRPMAKGGGGGGQGGGKGIASAPSTNKAVNDPMGLIEDTYHPGGYQGPGANY